MDKLDLKMEEKLVYRMSVADLIEIRHLLFYSSELKPSFDKLLKSTTFICLYNNDKQPPDIEYSLIGVMAVSHHDNEALFRFRKFAKRADHVFQESHFNYIQEAGFLCVHDRYKGRGLSKMLREKTFTLNDGQLLDTFTVIREDNEKLRKTNARYGCIQRGKPFKSSRGDYNLVLYTREFTKATPELRKV